MSLVSHMSGLYIRLHTIGNSPTDAEKMPSKALLPPKLHLVMV